MLQIVGVVFAKEDARRFENLTATLVYKVVELVYDFLYSRLNDLDCTSKARASVAVEDGPFCSSSLATAFEQCILLGMEAYWETRWSVSGR